jgi:hypothetical protein
MANNFLEGMQGSAIASLYAIENLISEANFVSTQKVIKTAN